MKLRTWVILLGSVALARRVTKKSVRNVQTAISEGVGNVVDAMPKHVRKRVKSALS